MSSISVLRRYGWFALFVLSAIGFALVIAVLRRGKGTNVVDTAAAIKAELAGIRAEGALEKKIVELGAQKATLEVRMAYEAKKQDLEEQERVEAEELRADPVRLAGFLARVGSLQRHASTTRGGQAGHT